MKKELVIIKLGGSVITDKSKAEGVFRRKVVARIAREIVQAKRKKNFDLIIAHGAGSFGHPIAKKYKLDKGYLGARSLEGFTLTKMAMLNLSLLVWEELAHAGINACVVQPSAIVTTVSGKIVQFETGFVEKLLEKGITPLLFGDVVFDDRQGMAILSADQIVSFLGQKLKASQVFFVSDVDGVFDKNPKLYGDAKLISEINSRNYQAIIKNMGTHNRRDVTGEMKGKILEVKKDLAGIRTQLINGFLKDGIAKALGGIQIGTVFSFGRL